MDCIIVFKWSKHKGFETSNISVKIIILTGNYQVGSNKNDFNEILNQLNLKIGL
jgi:hypothetical protein